VPAAYRVTVAPGTGCPAIWTQPVSPRVALGVTSAGRLVDQPEANMKLAATASAVRLGLWILRFIIILHCLLVLT
jgi:hypothetical protein